MMSEPPQPARAQPALPLLLALGWLVPGAGLGWLFVLAAPAVSPQAAAWLLAAVTLPALGLYWVANAGRSAGWALALIAAAIVFLSDATLSGRSGRIDTGLDAQSALKFAVWTLGLLLVLWRWRQLQRLLRHGPTGWLVLFALWCLCSTAWSLTPLYTAAASVALLGMAVVAGSLALAMSEKQGLLIICGTLMLAMLLSLVLYELSPAQALTPMENGLVLRLSGLFGSPNNLGRAAALTMLLGLLLLPMLSRGQGWVVLLLALLLGGACLHLSDSRGATLGLAAAVAVLLLGRRLALAAALAVLTLCAVLLLAATPALLEALMSIVSRSGRLDEVTSFTGRTEIWGAVWQMILRAPLLGHGFASTRELIPDNYQGAFGWTTTSAHNLWLQAWVTTGLAGLLLLLLGQLAWLRQALTRPQPVRDAVVVFVLVVGIFEASALGPSVNLLSFVLLWALALGLRPAAG